MKRILLLTLVIINLIHTGCIFDFEDDYEEWVYEVYEIYGKLIDEFGTTFHPVEIKIMKYLPRKIILGSVKFNKTGWIPISDEQKTSNSFRVWLPDDIRSKYHLKVFTFRSLVIDNHFMRGVILYEGPAVESPPLVFKAASKI